MSRLLVILQAISTHPKEVLRTDTTNRCDIRVPANGFRVALGKNATTGIADAHITRKCLTVRMMAPWECESDNSDVLVQMDKAVKGVVSVNGELKEGDGHKLRHGDVLTIHSVNTEYQYKVVVSHEDCQNAVESIITGQLNAQQQQQHPPKEEESDSGNECAIVKSEKTLQTSSSSLPSSLADEFVCAFCLEILFQATTIVPCGHSFCRGCIVQCTVCPTCRGPRVTTVPCRTMDNVIATLVQQPAINNCFEKDDIATYQERSNEQGKVATLINVPPRKRLAIGTGNNIASVICIE